MILALNTSTIQFSIALMKNQGSLIAEYTVSPATRNFNGFMPTLNSMFKASGIEIKDIKAVVVTMGPGSFTGLRVGLSAAKGLTHGLGIPIVGVSGLEAMANQFPSSNYQICPMITSRKGEIFISLYKRARKGDLIKLIEDISLKFTDLPSVIEVNTIFMGNDFDNQASLIKNILEDKAILAPPNLWCLRASAVGALGLKRIANKDFDDIMDLVPSYLKAPDIRPNASPILNKI